MMKKLNEKGSKLSLNVKYRQNISEIVSNNIDLRLNLRWEFPSYY